VDERFAHTTYTLRRKVFKLFGGAFHVFDEHGNVVLYAKQKSFKLREDIRLYTGEDLSTEVLAINARQVIDFAAAYDVTDPSTGSKVGALRRKGWKSFVRDEWQILDAADNQIGMVQEESQAVAILRRLLGGLIPQTFHVTVSGQHVARFHQRFNPFVYKLDLDFTPDSAAGVFDRRLGLAAAVLVGAIEGRQGSGS